MATWIALLRGIGGGIRSLPMADLRAALEKAGLSRVRTYIQTGNVVFESRASAKLLARRISGCINDTFGFEPFTVVLTPAELEKAMRANPFRKAEAEHKSLHLFFMAAPPKNADIAGIERLKAPSETFVIKQNVLYFHAPEGFGTSKLAARIERLLLTDATARNWRTVVKIHELAVVIPANEPAPRRGASRI
jgi:uncharacterized protein (DUF1697 family)